MAAMKRKLTALDIDAVLKLLDAYFETLKQQWAIIAQSLPSPSWWRMNRLRFAAGVQFLIDCLDKLVLFVEGLIPAGTDKKAAVIMVLDKLFDYILTPCLPIWLRPFAPIIKDVVINFVISSMIDLIVKKYNKGIWKKELNNATLKKAIYRPRR